MAKKKRIVRSVSKLHKPVPERKLTKKEIDKISEDLFYQLKVHGGYGLSANQIGIDARISVINVIEPLVLVNPVITETFGDKTDFIEQCLSIPDSFKKDIYVNRWKKITIETDNLGVIEFEPTDTTDKINLGLIECITVQHEIDHLNGKLITDKDRRIDRTVTREEPKIGRNDKVKVKMPDGEIQEVKYKVALSLRHYGGIIL